MSRYHDIILKLDTRLSICKELLSLLASYPVFSFSKQVVQTSKKQIIGCRCCCQVWHLRTESCIASVRIRQEQTTRNKCCLHRVHCGHLDATLWQRFGCDHPCVRAKGCSSREIGSKERLLFLPVPFRPKSVRGGTDNVIIVRKSKHSVSRPKRQGSALPTDKTIRGAHNEGLTGRGWSTLVCPWKTQDRSMEAILRSPQAGHGQMSDMAHRTSVSREYGN